MNSLNKAKHSFCLNGNPNSIAGLFPDFCSYIFKDPKNITYRAIRVFNTHVYNTAFVWFTIKFSENFYPAFAKFLSYIVWEFYVGSVNIGDFFYFCRKFVNFVFIVQRAASRLFRYCLC